MDDNTNNPNLDNNSSETNEPIPQNDANFDNNQPDEFIPENNLSIDTSEPEEFIPQNNLEPESTREPDQYPNSESFNQEGIQGWNSPMQEREPFNFAKLLNPSKKTITVIGVVIAIIFAGAITVFAFMDNIMITFMPKQYVLKSMAKTMAASSSSQGYLPDFSKFKDSATSQVLNLHMLDDYSYYSQEISMSMGFLEDSKNKQASFSLNLLTPYGNFIDNSLYISTEKIALKMPVLFGDMGYIYIDTKDFRQKWNKSDYSRETDTKISNDVDVKQFIEDIFDPSGFEREKSKYQSHSADNIASAAIRLEQNITVKKTDQQNDVNIFRCVVKSQDIKNFITVVIEEMYAYNNEINRSVKSRYKIEDDVIVNIYVDKKGFVTYIEMESFDFSFTDEYRSTWNITTEADIAFNGQINPMDDIAINIRMSDYDDYLDTEFSIQSKSSIKDGVASLSFKMDMIDYIYNDNYLLGAEYTWDKQTQTSNNLEAVFYVTEPGYDIIELKLVGNLIENPSLIELSDAKLTYVDEYDTEYGIDIEYICKPVLPEDVSIENQPQTCLFDIDYETFEEIVYENVMKNIM